MNAAAALLMLLPLAVCAAGPAVPPRPAPASASTSASPASTTPGPTPATPAAADPASGALAPLRPQAIELLKQSCPSRVERLLKLAAPEALEDTGLAAEICLCTDMALENTPETTPVDGLQEVASTATLTCAQPGVTARNQALTRQRFAGHLAVHGFSERQMDGFSRCLAEGYWQASFAGVLQGRKTQVSGPALWSDCAEQVGRPNTPLPSRPAPAASAAASSGALAPLAPSSAPAPGASR